MRSTSHWLRFLAEQRRAPASDRWFESVSLQRRVRNEPTRADSEHAASDRGFGTTTIESKTNIFRACEPGRLTGVAVPVHVGRRMIVLQTSIYRADGKLAAMMVQTQMVLPRGSATLAGEGGSKAYVPTQPVFP
jgi:hypothetical protein